MRYFAVLAILFLDACVSNLTGTADDARVDPYTLAFVNQKPLPAPTDHANGSRWVLSGSLVLRPNGYYTLSESDSVWNGRTFAREERTEGGTWVADGSLLTLTDTATEVIDTYGTMSAAYFGSIGPSSVVLNIPTDDGNGTEIYRYQR